MKLNYYCIAIIPARGGSKRVLRKNIRLLAGLPLIEYSIRSALKAISISRVIVSTDDQQIAEISRNLGAEVPFTRPPGLHEKAINAYRLALSLNPDNELAIRGMNLLEGK